MEITQTRYNTMPEQVQENMDNIKVLKEIVNTPAVIYNATVEIDTGDGNVDTSNIIETVETTQNAYVLDTVGSLFKIVSMVGTTVYILYVASIRGTQGATGANGADGVSITNVELTFIEAVSNGNKYSFTITLSNGTTINSGEVILPNPDCEYQILNLDTNKVTGGTVRYFTLGNAVTVEFYALTFANNLSDYTNLYDGTRLPKTKNNENLEFCIMSQDSTKPILRLRVDLNGQFQLRDTINNNNKYYGTFSYLKRD